MKSTIITTGLLACASLVAAAPAAEAQPNAALEARGRDNGNNWRGWGSWWGRKRPYKEVFDFSSSYFLTATPDQVVATNQTKVPGQPGAVGYYNYGINAALDTICYNITLVGVTGDYQSPAKTATHIHEAVYGRAGPPRIAFPNPVADANNPNVRRSVGCLTGPFTTGILANGTDTGNGFKLAQIEANPAGFFTDVHTAAYSQGVVRAQLA